MLYAGTTGGMQLGQGIQREVRDLQRFVVVHTGHASDGAAGEANSHILCPVAVGVRQQRSGVHAGDPLRHNGYAGFLEHLSHHGRRRNFARLHDPARHRPAAAVRTTLEQDLPLVVEHQGADARQEHQVVADLLTELGDVVGNWHGVGSNGLFGPDSIFVAAVERSRPGGPPRPKEALRIVDAHGIATGRSTGPGECSTQWSRPSPSEP